MTLSAISTDNLALAAGLPFEVRPDSAQFAVLLAQEPGGGLAPVQSSGGTLQTSGTGGGGGGGNSAASILGTVTPNYGDYLAFSNSGGTLVGVSPTNPLPVGGTLTLSTGSTLAVTGSFYQTTQPISAASLPLPAGAATASGVGSIVTALGSPFQAGANIGNTVFGATQSGTWTVGLSTGQTITLGGSNAVTLAAGSANAGTLSVGGGTLTAISSNVPAYLQAVSSGGASLASFTNAASSSLLGTIKASSGQIFGYDVSNSGTAGAWVRLLASSTGTVGVGTPVVRLYLPPASARNGSLDVGAFLSTGMIVVATAGAADNDTSTFTTANQVMCNFWWK